MLVFMSTRILQTQEIIRSNIQLLNQNISTKTVSKRNLLNKWFLDSIKNYFMEQHAAPLIMKELGLKSPQKVKELMHSICDSTVPKYMSILINYVRFLIKFEKMNQFKTMLNQIMESETESSNKSISNKCEKTIRKQFVSLMIMTFCNFFEKIEINSFYDLWNITFPNDEQKKRRLSKYDFIKNPTISELKECQNTSIPSNPAEQSSQINNSFPDQQSPKQSTGELNFQECTYALQTSDERINSVEIISTSQDINSLSVNASPRVSDNFEIEFYYTNNANDYNNYAHEVELQDEQDNEFESNVQSNNYNQKYDQHEPPFFVLPSMEYVPLYENEQLPSDPFRRSQFLRIDAPYE